MGELQTWHWLRNISNAICQEIAQKTPSCMRNEAKAAKQAEKDAQARIRAANIFKRKNASTVHEGNADGLSQPCKEA